MCFILSFPFIFWCNFINLLLWKTCLNFSLCFFKTTSKRAFFKFAPAANGLVQANILLVAWNGRMLFFWSRSAELDQNFFSVLPDGIPYSSSDLLHSSVPFTWTIYSQSSSICPFFFRTKYSKINFSSFRDVPGQRISSPTPFLQKHS